MTIEATLTRELNIRFIDARTLATEAKLELGINGYPSKDQIEEIIARSISIFQNKPENIQGAMVDLKNEFDVLKDVSIRGSCHSSQEGSAFFDDVSVETTTTSFSKSSKGKSWIKKSFSSSFTRNST